MKLSCFGGLTGPRISQRVFLFFFFFFLLGGTNIPLRIFIEDKQILLKRTSSAIPWDLSPLGEILEFFTS